MRMPGSAAHTAWSSSRGDDIFRDNVSKLPRWLERPEPDGRAIGWGVSVADGPEVTEGRLRDLKAITDTALGRLDGESLLNVLLGRVREILNADTAAVLLLDESGHHLIATAARGIEAEVHQGVRIPLGTGFAGRIASDGRPVALDRVDATTVYNPILWESGIKAMLGVPLMVGGDVIGVLHVGSRETRSFTPEDTHLLELAADRVALGTLSRVVEAERAAAGVLQRSLLPSDLPELPDVELAARYVPAARGGVGGDWYDVFCLPSGRLCMVIGDVAGHGVRPGIRRTATTVKVPPGSVFLLYTDG